MNKIRKINNLEYKVNETVVGLSNKSVLEQDVDAIVNAANTSMRGGGGLDAAVHMNAGPKLLDELVRLAPHGSKVGEAILTLGYKSKQPYIIHVAGPIWRGGFEKEAELLQKCYENVLLVSAKQEGITTLGFCGLSTGIYHFPLYQATEIAVRTVFDYLLKNPKTKLTKIIFATFKREEYNAYREVVNNLVRKYND